MTTFRPILALVAVLALAACDPAPEPKAAPSAAPAADRAGPIAWNAATGAFSYAGKPLRTVKLWTFDGSTEGYTAAGGELVPEPDPGLRYKVIDPVLRSPRGLAVDGSAYSVVLVRLTRVKAGAGWNGALYYVTPQHADTGAFFGKPIAGKDPAVGETVVLAYDMARQAVGGDDWKISLVDQIRLDLENGPGAEFVIHQIAIAENANLGPPPESQAEVAPGN